jgi:hypothetical protein
MTSHALTAPVRGSSRHVDRAGQLTWSRTRPLPFLQSFLTATAATAFILLIAVTSITLLAQVHAFDTELPQPSPTAQTRPNAQAQTP